MSEYRPSLHFHQGAMGRILLNVMRVRSSKHAVLFVPPFGEEMNKTRRQMSVTARQLALKGFSSVIVDLGGTGDSEGEFRDARWRFWIGDIRAAIDWLQDNGMELRHIIACRLGCALAADAAADAEIDVQQTIFWQPVESGGRFMQRFLRVAVASSLMTNESPVTVGKIRSLLIEGHTYEIAGYELSRELLGDVEAVSLSKLVSKRLGRVTVVIVSRAADEVASRDETRIEALISGWGTPAYALRAHGPPFWASSEVVVNEDLARLTAEVLD